MLVTDELASVVVTLAPQFPDRSEAEIRAVVGQTYQRLASQAKVTAHLIPLTHNRARAALDSNPAGRR